MALNAAQIANAASYFAGQNRTIGNLIAHAPENVSRLAAGGALGRSGIVSAPAVAQKKKSATPQLDNVEQTALALGLTKKSDLSDPNAQLGRWLNKNTNPVYGFANALLQKQGVDQAPVNGAQWLMNLLSTPLYASSRFVQGLGKAVADNNTTDPKTGAAQKLQDDPIGFFRDSIGEGFAQSFGGLARGMVEGFGARFDGERPRTEGQNFEDIGLTKAVEDTAAGAGATPTGSHFIDNTGTIGGLLGFAGDVALDPSTYVGGLGLLKGLQGGATALSDTVRAGEGVAAAAKAAAKGAVAGVDKAAAERAAATAAKAQRSALMKGDISKFTKAGGVAEDFYVTQQVARDAAANMAGVPRDEELPIPNKIADTPKIPHVELRAAVDELLPRLTGTVSREVPAEQILKMSARPGERAMQPALADAIRQAAASPTKVSEIRPAIAAIAATKEGHAALAGSLEVAGRTMTVRDAVEAAATRRLTDGEAQPILAALDAHLSRQSARPATWNDPAALGSAIASLMRPAEHAPAPVDASPGLGLFAAVRDAKTMTERKQVLLDALGTQQTKYQTFDQAMLGATSGQVEVDQMREMLKALGIDSHITDPNTVRNALSGAGAARWEEIQAAVRTPDEVLTDHGVSAAEGAAAQLADEVAQARQARAAQLADEVAQARQARAAYQDTVRSLGYDPATVTPPRYNPDGTPNAGASIGNAIHHGVAKLGELFHGKQLSGVYGRSAMLTVHKSVLSSLKLRGGGVTAQARAENLLSDYLGSTVAVENYYRSLGQIPYLPNGAGRTPFYVSFGQVLANLPRQIVADSLFRPLKYSLGRTVGDTAYKAGLSIYPTTIATGARTAMQAFAAERSTQDAFAAVLQSMKNEGARNAFQGSEEGARALVNLAEALVTPEFERAMKSLHDSQLLVATRIAQKTSEGLVMPTGARIAAALAAGSERGAITKAVRDGYDDIAKATSDLDGAPTLAHDLATTRLDNALVNGVLGQWGHALAKVDGRAATAAKVARKVGPDATRQATTASTRKMLDDTDEMTVNAIQDRVDLGELEDTTMERVRTLGEFQHELGQQGFFGRILQGAGAVGRAGEGSYGKGALFPLQVQAERAASADASATHAMFSNWLHGKGGVRDRLGESLQLGRRATPAESNAAMQTWWTALAQTMKRYPGLADGSLHDALLRGAKPNARTGIRDGIPALDDAQAGMAMELYGHIQQIFQSEAGPLHRLGITGADLNQHLLRFGQAEHLADDNATALEMADHWMNIDPAAPLNTLQAWRVAMDHAAQRPLLAAAVTRQFANPQDWGLTEAAARAAGWRTIDTNSGSLGRWFEPGTMLPPEIRRNLIYVQHALDELDRGLPRFWSTLFAPVDAMTSVLKPSMTIWRLGHHVSNILGNNLFLMLHGYSPLHNLRTVQTLRMLPGTPQLDDSALSHFNDTWMQNVADRVPGFTGPLKDSVVQQNARVALKNGQVLDLAPEQLAQLALRDGIVLTAHQAKDLAPEQEINSLTGAWGRFTSSRLNVIARTNRKIANGTALYENITRLSVMIQQLERGTYRSIDEAMSAAVDAVQKTHPTRESLSVADRKYTTRIVLFHNWVRGAIGGVLRVALERPKLVTIPSDWQYNMAEGQGLQPESIGKPFPNDPRIASYFSNGLLGPTWISGLSPFGGYGDLVNGTDPNGPPHLWGASLSAPQMDALTNYFGGVNFNEDPLTNARVLSGGVNPVLSAPLELVTNSQLGSETGQQIYDPRKGDWAPQYAQWLWNQTGFPASVTSAFGLTGTHATWTDAENQGDEARKLFNFLTGLKTVDYTNPTSAKIGTSQAGQEIVQELRNAGYSDEAIKALQSYWK